MVTAASADRRTAGARGRAADTGFRRDRRRPSGHISQERVGIDALRGVSLDIVPGEILGLVGESGSGKSVLGFTLLGLLPKHAKIDGTVRVTGAGHGHR